METLGQKLKYLRKEAGLTQTELAEIFFVVKSTIAKYETDKIDVGFQMLKKYANYFNVSLAYFDE